MNVEESWHVIRDWLARHHPTLLPMLHAPADDAAFTSLEDRIGFALPDDFKQSYRIYDGSDETCGPLVGLPLMSLAVIARSWDVWADVADEGNVDLDAECRSHPPGAVKLVYASRGWIPFAGDGQNYVAIDFDPGPAGTRGQIINSGRDDMMRHVIAGTFTGFMEFVATQFAASRVARSTQDERFLQLGDDGGDLLTSLRPLLGLPAFYEP
jgi:cell wall assembly regulator SMI1